MSSLAISTDELIANSEENRALLQSSDTCDRYDYMIAVACGAVGGMIDIFLVGAPGKSVLGSWTDSQVDNVVKRFAKSCGWSGDSNNIASAIGYLEKKFRVNYDHRHSTDVNNLFNMGSKNHHMKSLGHSPDIIGLFFSILNQFTSTASFIADGQLITIKTDTFELQGGNFIAKIFCGIANWFGHIMSDIAGSSGGRGGAGAGRGSGVVMPFYELFGFCKFGKFSVGKDKQDLATIATRAFQEGYDFRFGLAQAIPVVITDLAIRLVWALRRYFQYEKPLNQCIPTQSHADLRIMLIFGHGTLCAMDGLDAFIRSGGNALLFFLRFNLVAWTRFGMLVFKEVCIRVGIASPLQAYLDAFKRINASLLIYLHELEKIDIEAFKRETEEYNRLIVSFDQATNNEELNQILLETYKRMGYDKPWQGDFKEHMSNKNARLIFK